MPSDRALEPWRSFLAEIDAPPERHDLTLKLWLEAINEERASRYR